MSNYIFPTFNYIDVAVKRSMPIYSTEIATDITTGKETRNKVWPIPQYNFELTLTIEKGIGFDEVSLLSTIYSQMRGSWDTFLYTDPYENSVILAPFGRGTGIIATTYQLKDGFGKAINDGIDGDPVYNLNGTPLLYRIGDLIDVATYPYTISSSGLVHFTNQTSADRMAGEQILWSGSFYRRCRFIEDKFELTQVGYSTFTTTITFETVL